MEHEHAPDVPAPDLPEQIETMVGRLARLWYKLGDEADCDTVKAASELLAKLQQVVSWEPAEIPSTLLSAALADELEVMAGLAPRPPATRSLLEHAARALRARQDRGNLMGRCKLIGYSVDGEESHRIDLTLKLRFYEDVDGAEGIARAFIEAARSGTLHAGFE